MMRIEGRIAPDCVAYSDESMHNKGRWRSICVVSLKRSEVQRIKDSLAVLLENSDVEEFKWQKCKTGKYRLCAEKIIDCVLPECFKGTMRIDTIIWDTHDSRHDIQGRDDIANLQRMYFHLVRNVAVYRWPDSARWHFYPDEMSSMKWKEFSDCVDRGTRKYRARSEAEELFTPELNLSKVFRISHLSELSSKDEPLIQTADLFAGIGAYSRNNYERYCCLKDTHSGQASLFGSDTDATLSKGDDDRCQLIARIVAACKDKGLSVSVDEDHGLRTKYPTHRVNFWRYIPQREEDKAPLRSERN